MNKVQKIIISISVYVVVCFLTFLAVFFWNASYNPIFLDAFLWWKHGINYSKFDSILSEMLSLSIIIWIILAIPTFSLYKHWADKK